MSFDSQEFLADVLSKIADPAKKRAIEEALNVSEVKEAIGAGYARQSDYSRNMDELKSARESAEAQINQERGALETERTGLVSWYQDASKEFDDTVGKLKRYESEYGDLSGEEQSMNPSTSSSVTREEYERALNERDQQAIRFTDLLTDLKMEHKDRFSERLDTEALFRHQQETNLPLNVAYKDFVSERVAEADKLKHEEALKQAREEGVNEGRNGRDLPVQPDNPSPVMQAMDKPTTSEDRVANASSKWREQFAGGAPSW